MHKTIFQKWYTEQWTILELYGNHLEGDTRVVFHAKNTDTVDPGNIVVWENDTDIAVILICNIHHMDSDVWYDWEHNYGNSRQCIKIKKFVSNVQKFSSLPSFYAFLGNDYTPEFFGRGKLSLCREPLKKKNLPMYLGN